jgi:hypothetical protein
LCDALRRSAAELLLSGRIKDGEKVKITAGRDDLVFNGATVAAAA